MFFNQESSRVHIRLSHTTNNVNGIVDYDGEIDPRKLRLAISHKERTTLFVRNCSFVRFKDLSIRFGGEHTLRVRQSNDILFDHVRIAAGSHGVHLGAGNARTVIRHCEIRGGMPKYIYRNLIDLRKPTADFRPRHVGDQNVFRSGHLYKSNGVNGPLALFQNTCLVLGQAGQASFMHYYGTGGTNPRRSFNNIFVAVNPDRPIAYLPPPSFPGPTDGNCYFRVSSSQKPLLRFLPYRFQDEDFPKGEFMKLSALRASEFFTQSKTQYPPGYEFESIEENPQFRVMNPDGSPQPLDDLRLKPDSPARTAGVLLPPDLQPLDDAAGEAVMLPPSRDIGCYRFGSRPLRVGVNGRRRFPIAGTIP